MPIGVVGSAVTFCHRLRGLVSGNDPTTVQSCEWLVE
jgi:hypothetical protein